MKIQIKKRPQQHFKLNIWQITLLVKDWMDLLVYSSGVRDIFPINGFISLIIKFHATHNSINVLKCNIRIKNKNFMLISGDPIEFNIGLTFHVRHAHFFIMVSKDARTELNYETSVLVFYLSFDYRIFVITALTFALKISYN